MSVWSAVGYLVLGGVLGVAGQTIRLVVGVKKKHDEAIRTGKPLKEVFDMHQVWLGLIISVVVGIVAGILGILTFWGRDLEISRQLIITLLGVGYAGTDFIEGLVRKALPRGVMAK